jgi:hypothetical protein
MGLVPTTPWDEAVPLGTDLVSQGDNVFRLLKTQLREILGKEHDFDSSGQFTGRHEFPLSAESSIGGIEDLTNGMLVVANDTNALFARIAGTHTLVGSAGMLKGTLAARPTFGNDQRLYWASDEGVIYRDNGSAWEAILVVASGDSGKSVVFQDHFTDAPYVWNTADDQISTKWEVETAGSLPEMTCDWSALATVANGAFRGEVDSGTAGGSLQTLGIVSALAQNPVVTIRVRFGDSDDSVQRWGLASTWNSLAGVRPAKGIFFERHYEAAVQDDLLGVVVGAATTTKSLGAADGDWHTYKFVASGGDAVEFFYDGTSKGSVTGITLTGMLKLGFQLDSDDESNSASVDIDYSTVLSDAI